MMAVLNVREGMESGWELNYEQDNLFEFLNLKNY